MSKNKKEDLVEYIRENGYEVAKNEKSVIVKLPRFTTIILEKNASEKDLIIKFGFVNLKTAIIISILCYVFMIYSMFTSFFMFTLIPLLLMSIYWNIRRYKDSLEVKNLIISYLQNKF